MVNFKCEASYTERGVKIQFFGVINEDAKLDTLMALNQPEILIDMKATTGMNSAGIRTWIRWMQSIDTKKCKVIFQNCPKYFIDQVNLVHSFYPDNAIFESFYVVYYSKASGNEKFVLYRRGHEFNGPALKHPTDVRDEDTKDQFEIDVADSYFKFLEKQPPKT